MIDRRTLVWPTPTELGVNSIQLLLFIYWIGYTVYCIQTSRRPRWSVDVGFAGAGGSGGWGVGGLPAQSRWRYPMRSAERMRVQMAGFSIRQTPSPTAGIRWPLLSATAGAAPLAAMPRWIQLLLLLCYRASARRFASLSCLFPLAACAATWTDWKMRRCRRPDVASSPSQNQ